MRNATLGPVLLRAAQQLRRHEGERSKPYEDTEGVLTIGIGRNLEKGLSSDEIEHLFRNDLLEAEATARQYRYFDMLNDVRKMAIINMAFQLGAGRLLGFKKMHTALDNHNYEVAARECLDSRYAQQVPRRAKEIAEMIRTGTL